MVCNTPQAFDLIVGTSTGGILAMMIGSLHMTLDECAARWLRGDRDAAGALGARDWGVHGKSWCKCRAAAPFSSRDPC